jgi:hypothetical protein
LELRWFEDQCRALRCRDGANTTVIWCVFVTDGPLGGSIFIVTTYVPDFAYRFGTWARLVFVVCEPSPKSHDTFAMG